MSPAEVATSLVSAMRQARHIVVLTGAGISAESGIPTFRQAQTGLWARYDPQELATPQAFQRNPRLVWRWYQWRRDLVARAAPNAGHRALAALARMAPRLTLITQNVDGLHQQAGSRSVLELHGNLARNKCFEHGHIVAPGEELPPGDPDDPPRCPYCQSLIRPDVVWFGEALPREALSAAFEAAEDCDLFISAGTSALVYPAASIPLSALSHGATSLEVNTDETPISPRFDFILRSQSGVILPQLVRAAWPEVEI